MHDAFSKKDIMSKVNIFICCLPMIKVKIRNRVSV